MICATWSTEYASLSAGRWGVVMARPRVPKDTATNRRPGAMAVPDPARSRAGRHRPVDSRDLAGARDIASVVDARIRQHVHGAGSVSSPSPTRSCGPSPRSAPCPRTRPPGRTGRTRHPRSAPTGKPTATATPPIRSAPNPPTSPRPARRQARNLPGSRPGRRARRQPNDETLNRMCAAMSGQVRGRVLLVLRQRRPSTPGRRIHLPGPCGLVRVAEWQVHLCRAGQDQHLAPGAAEPVPLRHDRAQWPDRPEKRAAGAR